MGSKKRKPQTMYVPNPTPTTAPAQTAESQAFQQSLTQQLAAMSTQYQQQLGNMQTQYGQNAQSSNSVITALQESIKQQQAAGLQTQEQLKQAQAVSAQQAEMTENQRLASQASYADTRQQQTDQYKSLFGRLQNRRKAMSTTY